MGDGLLDNKVALICGVGPDLGRSLALRSAHAGADVVVAARDEDRLRAVADEIAAGIAGSASTSPAAPRITDRGKRPRLP